MHRRSALKCLGLGALISQRLVADNVTRPKILLRSSWASKNIGDIAHTPGVIRLLHDYIGDVEVYLWPTLVDQGVDKVLLQRFPKLKILDSKRTIEHAMQQCDFFLHGSGASLVAERDLRRWRDETGKPYGVYGISFPRRKFKDNFDTPPEVLAKTIALLNGADFAYFRESRSLAFARQHGCNSPVTEFAPDGAFACDLRDDNRADAYMKAHGLDEGKFLCVIPRYRFTPVWEVPTYNRPVDPVRLARNEEMKEHDHKHLREAITRIVEETDFKILICPEDSTHMALGKTMLYDRLTERVRKRVVWRSDYWLTGEATSTYIRSAGLFGNEMHSPILCIAYGIPAIVCRSFEQTEKGFMWEDIGLGDWLFDLDVKDQMANFTKTALRFATDPVGSKAKATRARRLVERRQRETMEVLQTSLATL